MKVLLAGGSGTLGRALVPHLRAAGHDVVVITRSPTNAERLRAAGCDPVVADVLDRDGLLAAVAGRSADAVLHQLTALRKPPLTPRGMRATNVLRERGTTILLEAARAVGATRMITQSIVFGYGYRRRRPDPVQEDAPFGEPEGSGVDPTLAALRSTERQVFQAQGIAGIALRYGLFYGLDAPMITSMLRRRMLPVADFDGAIPCVHHSDAASATVAALERGVAGRAYNVADDVSAAAGTSWRHAIEFAARTFGTPAPPVVPRSILRLAIPYAAELMTRMDLRVSSERAKRELGWSPRFASVEEGWAAAGSGIS